MLAGHLSSFIRRRKWMVKAAWAHQGESGPASQCEMRPSLDNIISFIVIDIAPQRLATSYTPW